MLGIRLWDDKPKPTPASPRHGGGEGSPLAAVSLRLASRLAQQGALGLMSGGGVGEGRENLTSSELPILGATSLFHPSSQSLLGAEIT